ncbi:hypothetical protein FSP39_010243 [Pinctada imbricata]|uniref:G-protein coupled receptors family 2 profile 2 domain-containing protein n=1 Tax=Pinctada imbricata TaxID=66713 RepID=A0AA88YDW6_PINIB|nr:hypothetical protein FSP39_010243 [Pinctada imbricata]
MLQINLVILILVLRAMFRSHVMQKKSSKEQTKYGIRSLCIILPVIGVTWVFGIFSINDDLVIFQYLFAIFNSFQVLIDIFQKKTIIASTP